MSAVHKLLWRIVRGSGKFSGKRQFLHELDSRLRGKHGRVNSDTIKGCTYWLDGLLAGAQDHAPNSAATESMSVPPATSLADAKTVPVSAPTHRSIPSASAPAPAPAPIALAIQIPAGPALKRDLEDAISVLGYLRRHTSIGMVSRNRLDVHDALDSAEIAITNSLRMYETYHTYHYLEDVFRTRGPLDLVGHAAPREVKHELMRLRQLLNNMSQTGASLRVRLQ